MSRFKFLKLLSKLSYTILTLKSKIEKSSRKLGNEQQNDLQQETEENSRTIGEPRVDPRPTQPPTPARLDNELDQTEEISRRIGEPRVDPRPTQPPTPARLDNELDQTEEISRRIGEPRVDPRPTQPPTPIRVRRIGEPRVDRRTTQPPNPIRLRIGETTIISRTTFIGVRKIGVATVNPRPKKTSPPRR
ncbi:hypothetical protein [Tolypothrix sp. NIES-4075]|uniref:hypothetical protein n=1 Tax=Tolypothrix sp. NIES-4075 TaxID=2005459 RepID=UPI00117EC7EE|nr:hypothetical protein [Tolypothrix sp. NIES-4075]